MDRSRDDEKTPQAVRFLRDAVAYAARLGVSVKRLRTDNGSAFRSNAFNAACTELGIKHKFTRPYQPQTNGKAERFIQSALREWAYGWTYQNSAQRTTALASWQQHYNCHRPHSGIGGVPPLSRLGAAGNSVLTLQSEAARSAVHSGGHQPALLTKVAPDAAPTVAAGFWPTLPRQSAGRTRPHGVPPPP